MPLTGVRVSVYVGLSVHTLSLWVCTSLGDIPMYVLHHLDAFL